MMAGLYLLPVSLPLALALSLTWQSRLRPVFLRLAPLAALPALVLSLTGPIDHVVVSPWLLLGAHFGLDVPSMLILFASSVLWMLSGVYAQGYLAGDPRRHRFFAVYLLAMSGNIGLILARDVVTFYMLFSLMTLAAYGLVVHEGSAWSFRAGRVYIRMAVFGEALLLSGFLLAVGAVGRLNAESIAPAIAGSPMRDTIMVLLVAGFGVKAGALPLHVWLPLAHPVAPTPASAVLSGCMIKAGLLGWLRFLPVGEVALPEWGTLCILAGLAAAFYGVAIGLAQVDPKTVLAYSSISQMGLMTIAIGIGLSLPEAAAMASVAAAMYALHHGLAKGALFLGVGMTGLWSQRRWIGTFALAGLTFAALALAGAPLTSGAVAKAYLKDAVYLSTDQWFWLLDWLLPLAAVGTGLLMARFLFLVLPASRYDSAHHIRPEMSLSFGLVILAVAIGALLLPSYYVIEATRSEFFSLTEMWAGAWPVISATSLALAMWYLSRRSRQVPRLKASAGDILVVVEWGFTWWPALSIRLAMPASLLIGALRAVAADGMCGSAAALDRLREVESSFARWNAAGLLLLAVVTVVVLLLLGPK